MTLNKQNNEKISQKYTELLRQASIAIGRKEAVRILHKAAKLQDKLYEISNH